MISLRAALHVYVYTHTLFVYIPLGLHLHGYGKIPINTRGVAYTYIGIYTAPVVNKWSSKGGTIRPFISTFTVILSVHNTTLRGEKNKFEFCCLVVVLFLGHILAIVPYNPLLWDGVFHL